MTSEPYDLLIIGAGINGAGLARDAAGRGLSVALVDKGDLGGGTSAASTKLIHGGLRYLEFYEFALVRKALAERETILRIAPHLAYPMPFVLPMSKGTRPSWMIRAGLFLYDHLARREAFPDSAKIDLGRDPAGRILDPEYSKAFRYWDGWVDDSRLVVLNCMDARRRGAEIIPRDGVASARFDGTLWHAKLESGRTLTARRIVNCAGPWAEEVARGVLGVNDAPSLDLVQGSHIVVPRIGGHTDAYMLQQPDGRIIFLIPYMDAFTLIGTTETRIATPGDAGITDEEESYLLTAANRFLRAALSSADVVASFAGIRPLVHEDDKSARETSRGWKLRDHAGVPALSVVGGKLTTYRLLAEDILERLAPGTQPWTAEAPLPGGDIPRPPGLDPAEAFDRWLAALQATHAEIAPDTVRHLARRYGTRALPLLEGGLGEPVGTLFAAEIDMLVVEEWATAADDILWHRTKAGLLFSDADRDKLEQRMNKSATSA